MSSFVWYTLQQPTTTYNYIQCAHIHRTRIIRDKLCYALIMDFALSAAQWGEILSKRTCLFLLNHHCFHKIFPRCVYVPFEDTVVPLPTLSLCSQKTQLSSKQLSSGVVLCSKCPALFQNFVAGKIVQLRVCFMQ